MCSFIFSTNSFFKVKELLSSGETRETFQKTFSYYRFAMFSVKKLFIMYLLNNTNYLCKKIIRRKKQVAKRELIVSNAFSERVKIL